MIYPYIRLPDDHKLIRIGMRMRLWSKPDHAAGKSTAELLLSGMWAVFIITSILTLPSPYACVVAAGAVDILLQLCRIKTYLLFLPLQFWVILFLGLDLLQKHG